MNQPSVEMIIKAIHRDEPGLSQHVVRTYAETFAAELDPRLIPNVEEWIRGETMQDIWIDDYCVGMIQTLTHGSAFYALRVLNIYAKDPKIGLGIIWKGRR